MDDAQRHWHPTGDELEAILAEMRPIIADFARRARTGCGRQPGSAKASSKAQRAGGIKTEARSARPL